LHRLFIYFWHAPPGVHTAKYRHQSLEWTILGHFDCFIQAEVIGFQVMLDRVHHVVRGHLGGLHSIF